MKKRPAARLLVVDPQNRILLFNFKFDKGPLKGQDYWATVGGGIEPGESFEEAARRELLEETGITEPVTEKIHIGRAIFQTPSGETVDAEEHFFLVTVPHSKIDYSNHTELETQVMRSHRWWTREELETTSLTVFPENILEILEPYLPEKV
ncbi:NUDIX hydrolase [Pseudovibrio sp. JE062]|uniref:NUDIX hydrolase n=1 Tax=Pseudovibrio sp. JE062 TaxID=439495 RepID=UPI000186C406|nr:NUDIX domain-containing protein [Pseudovibrio sp. JE062]EEA94997.1 nudix hydrolase [Pseudovibrio sp. JE062]